MRKLVIILSFALCFSALWAVWAQRQQLSVLHAERQQQASMAAADSVEVPQASTGQTAEPDAPLEAVSIELLRLRGEVTRLNLRKRELTGVEEEGQRLRADLA